MAGLHLALPVARVLPAPARWIGFAAIGAGVAAVGWSAWTFDRSRTTIKPFETSSSLVTHGLYRCSRNPIYAGMVAALLGFGLVLGTASPFLVIPAFALLIQDRFIRVEERMLEETFGPEYRNYKQRVRRWI